ncbi:ShlB/FhaC/HecB family hemolysin secretion/activation protein [Parasphingopyxis algicola]|uniref:ShlB/FhaC/HecB family hemolysin secretion/activation protein n=1 Tax=Parasphingopyxis algicola TaxID=2026624 RepID=UPI0015A1836F|nr:ShlB/FhaC/HecB family hemolysin secretion/activation protein [Parasphingopyxis algicola]QLC25853.1 ShlB/FhaC/HecB family hemolysin secretion/activation protein [Parasphingopyxis algicola]
MRTLPCSMLALAALVSFGSPLAARSASPGIPYDFADTGGPVSQIAVDGATRYDSHHLLAFAAAHARASHGALTASGTADAIALMYREDGYPLAEAHYRYDAATGTLTFHILEGFIERVSVEGFSDGVAARIAGYADRLIGRAPLTQAELERAIVLASDLSGVTLVSELDHEPGDAGTRLRIIGSERRQSGAVGIETIPLRPDAAVRIFAVEEIYSLATAGDMLRLLGQATLDRGDDWSVAGTLVYRTPVGASGSYIEAFAGNVIARRDLGTVATDDRLRGYNAALIFGYPIRRSVHRFTYLLGEYEFVEARSRFGGQRLSSTSHSLRAHAITGVNLDNGGIVQAGLTLSAGRRPGTDAGELRDGARSFAHIRGEFGLVVPIDRRNATYFRLEARGQWADTRLPEVERFALGHAPFLRGYAPAEIEGDSGYGASIEFDHVIETGSSAIPSVVPTVFFDIGAADVRDRRVGETGDRWLASAGIGAEVRFGGAISIAGWAAMPLRDGPQSRSGNPAFHISLSKGW